MKSKKLKNLELKKRTIANIKTKNAIKGGSTIPCITFTITVTLFNKK